MPKLCTTGIVSSTPLPIIPVYVVPSRSGKDEPAKAAYMATLMDDAPGALSKYKIIVLSVVASQYVENDEYGAFASVVDTNTSLVAKL